MVKSVTCPKCGKPSWSAPVERRGSDTKVIVDGSAKEVVYLYTRYRHYVGTRKAITLAALEKILEPLDSGESMKKGNVMKMAKEAAGEKTVDHYVRKK